MSWYILIALSKIFDATASVVAKKMFMTKKVDPVSFIILYCITTGVLVGIVGLFMPDFGMFPGKDIPWLSLLLMCFLYGFGSVFYYKGIKMVEASRMAIISASGTVFTVLASVILLGDKLDGIKYIGGIIIIIGIIITNFKKGHFQFGKGEFYVLLGSAFFGLEVLNDKFIMTTMGTYFYLVIAYLAPLVLIGSFFRKSLLAVGKTLKTVGIVNIGIYTLLLLVQAIFFFSGLKISDSPSMVTMFALCGRVLLVIMSIVLLKETSNLKQKIIGTIVVVAGLALLG